MEDKKSILFPLDFCSIDVETTGLNSQKDRIIEISGIRYRLGHAVDSFSELIKPAFKTQLLPPEIIELTGITDEMLAEGQKLSDVLPRFLAFIADDVVLGHNIDFDLRFIDSACRKRSLPINDWISLDTLPFSRVVFPHLQGGYSLANMSAACGINSSTFHRSLADAETAASSYLVMRNKLAEKIKVCPRCKSQTLGLFCCKCGKSLSNQDLLDKFAFTLTPDLINAAIQFCQSRSIITDGDLQRNLNLTYLEARELINKLQASYYLGQPERYGVWSVLKRN